MSLLAQSFDVRSKNDESFLLALATYTVPQLTSLLETLMIRSPEGTTVTYQFIDSTAFGEIERYHAIKLIGQVCECKEEHIRFVNALWRVRASEE